MGDSEIQAYPLGVADMQVTVGFGGESGHNAALVLVFSHIISNDLADKIFGAGG